MGGCQLIQSKAICVKCILKNTTLFLFVISIRSTLSHLKAICDMPHIEKPPSLGRLSLLIRVHLSANHLDNLLGEFYQVEQILLNGDISSQIRLVAFRHIRHLGLIASVLLNEP